MLCPSLALLIMLVAGAGCAPGNDGRGAAAPVHAAAQAPRTPPPPGARGKIAADQVGKLSPVAAFEGGGADWDIAIHATTGLRHDVRLRWGGGAHVAGGTVRYRASAPGTHRLEGTLYGVGGDRGLRIDLRRGDCRDAGRVFRYAVMVAVDGMVPLRGCGELALP
ncbi:hypothetical protein MQC88_10160 [Luteimonas sp. 50]|uniref:Uncharacterized protein n=1 Tax=Cognatiluteimonas sedimenti TaxID=2927791 RepID=A0ABT0A5M9_9GAMM|nr:hypothetical protein [Lysobacter sedimenti]MCJ0826308.1 hypothetical protein [Lysobacter sedimenti]